MNDHEYFNNQAFCPLPWVGLYVDPTGRVDHCCISQNNIGNINQDTLSTIINSDKNQSIKTSMLSGKIVSGCNSCYRVENVNGQSLRNGHIIQYQYKSKNVYDKLDTFEMRYADIRLRNTCNFSCVYCQPDLSSTWALEEKQFQKINDLTQTIDFFKANAHTLDRVYLAGGEPLLIKENEQILEHLYSVNPNCSILVNTNLSEIDNNRIFKLLFKFKNVRWMVSAEDTESRFEYIRYHSSWEKFVKNLKTLRSLTDQIQFNMVYFTLNAKTVFNFIEFIESIDIPRKNSALGYISNGGGFPGFDPRCFNTEYKQELIQLLGQSMTTEPSPFNTSVEQVQNFLNQNFKSDINSVFQQLNYFDKKRNINSREVFVDLYKTFNQ